MKLANAALFGAGLLLAGAATAAESGAELWKSKNCLGCHATDQKKVGPAFKDVAAKYKGDKNAEATIIAKLKEGKGHPAKVQASDAELKSMVEQVLATK